MKGDAARATTGRVWYTRHNHVMTDMPEDRKPYSYYDPLSIRREAQEDGQLHVPTLAQLWLREFAKVGLSEVDASSGSPLKQSDSYYPWREPLYDDAMPLKLDGTHYTLRLKLDGRRSDRGYRTVVGSGYPAAN